MKLGFFAGAILATWLSLTYPAEVRTVFDKLVTIAQQVLQPSSTRISNSDMITPE